MSLITFTIYQALPSSLVPKRNDSLIFDEIGHYFFANMILGCVWRMFFQFSNWWGFLMAEIAMAGMLMTSLDILFKSQKSNVNKTEFFTLRVGFSLYSGWLTAAMILGASLMFKALGLDESILTSE